jgi:hypothetical protein
MSGSVDEFEYSVMFKKLGTDEDQGIDKDDWMSIDEAEEWFIWLNDNNYRLLNSNFRIVKRRKAGPVEEID